MRVGIFKKRLNTVIADDVAQVIYDAATDGTNRLRYFCGEDTGDLVKIRRDLPEEKFLDLMPSRFFAGDR